MTDNHDNYQLELFSGARERPAVSKGRLGSRFFNFLCRHEKKILIAIGIVVSCIISFSWGVKRGREVSSIRNQDYFDLAGNTNKGQGRQKKTISKQARKKEQIAVQLSPVVKNRRAEKKITQEAASGYTIQLASYKAKRFAEAEAEALKKRGLAPLILYKGKYVVLCVGKFSDKDKAKNSLSQLKKRYKDCYLRRL